MSAYYATEHWRDAKAIISTATGVNPVELNVLSAEFTEDRTWAPSITATIQAAAEDVPTWGYNTQAPRRMALDLQFGRMDRTSPDTTRSTSLNLVARVAAYDVLAGTITYTCESLDYVTQTEPYSTGTADAITYNAGTTLQTITTNTLGNVDPANVWGLRFETAYLSRTIRRPVQWRKGQPATSFLQDAAAAAGLSVYTTRSGTFRLQTDVWDLSNPPVPTPGPNYEINDFTLLGATLKADNTSLVNTVMVAYSDGAVAKYTPLTSLQPGYVGRRLKYLDYRDYTQSTARGDDEADEILRRGRARLRLWELRAVAHYPLKAGDWVRLNTANLSDPVIGRCIGVTHTSEGTMTVTIAEPA